MRRSERSPRAARLGRCEHGRRRADGPDVEATALLRGVRGARQRREARRRLGVLGHGRAAGRPGSGGGLGRRRGRRRRGRPRAARDRRPGGGAGGRLIVASPPGGGTIVEGSSRASRDRRRLRAPPRGARPRARRGGIEVVAQVGDANALQEAIWRERPDVAIVDVRMPPSHTDEGARARRRFGPSIRRSGSSCSRRWSRRGTRSSSARVPEGLRLPAQGPRARHRRLRGRRAANRARRDGDRPTGCGPAPRRSGRADPDRRADSPRARGARTDRRRALEPGDLAQALPQPEDGRDPRERDLHEARPASGPDDHRRVLAVLAYLRASEEPAPSA